MFKGHDKKTEIGFAGCISVILILSGILLAITGTGGYLLGLFGHRARIRGARMPFVDLETFIGLLVIGAIMFGLGYGIDYLVQRKNRKKNSPPGV